MATEIHVRNFRDIIEAIMRRAKIADEFANIDTLTLTTLKELINSKYEEVTFAKKWEWRATTRTINTTPKYTTGTASVTNGQRRVTLSAAATVTTDFKNRYFRVSGDAEYYEIISVSSTANRTLELATTYKGTTAATASYTIWKSKYGLFPDFIDLFDITPQAATSLLGVAPMEDVSQNEMAVLQATAPFAETAYPEKYTIEGVQNYSGPTMGTNFIMGYDFMGGAGYDVRSVVFYPSIFSQVLLNVKYGKYVPLLVNNTDEPLLPKEERGVLVKGALADWFSIQRLEKTQLLWQKMYDDHLGRLKGAFDKTENRLELCPENYRKNQLSLVPRTYVITTT